MVWRTVLTASHLGVQLSDRTRSSIRSMQEAEEYQRTYAKKTETVKMKIIAKGRQLQEHRAFSQANPSLKADYRKGQLDLPSCSKGDDHSHSKWWWLGELLPLTINMEYWKHWLDLIKYWQQCVIRWVFITVFYHHTCILINNVYVMWTRSRSIYECFLLNTIHCSNI